MSKPIRITLFATGLASVLGLTAIPALAADEHVHHPASVDAHPMMHGAMQAMDSDAPHAHHQAAGGEQPMMHGAMQAMEGDDPHAQHRAMMARSNFQVSEHAYHPGKVRLVDMHGRVTSLSEALNCDKPVMANFIYTTCTTICPVMSATFSQVQAALGPAAEDVCMVSISIDPEHDTPARLRDYAQRFNAGANWQFYTGELADIIAAQRSFDVYRGNKMSHEPTTLIRSAEGDTWTRIDGLASAAEIVEAYRGMIER